MGRHRKMLAQITSLSNLHREIMTTLNLIQLKEKIRNSKRGLRIDTVRKLLGFNDRQFSRLSETRLLTLTPSGKTVTDVRICFIPFCNSLKIKLTVEKPYNRTKTYGPLDAAPHLCIEQDYYKMDREFLYSLAYTYVVDGLDAAHRVAEKKFAEKKIEKEKARAGELDLNETEYQKQKDLGKVDWVRNKVYDLRTQSQSVGTDYTWRFNGKDYTVRGVSLFWSSPQEILANYSGYDRQEFMYALNALFEYCGESKASRRTPPPSAEEIERRKRQDAIDDFYRDNKRMNDMYDRL